MEKFTVIRSNQNRASCLKIFRGFIRNRNIIMANANGLMNGGMLKLALYKKLRMLNVQTTPKMAANSMRCCSDKWFLGSSSKISTWLTPDERQPYTLTPIKKINSIISNGPLYNRNAIFKFCVDTSWKMAEMQTGNLNNAII